jgi:hypothetical protein
MVPTRPGQVEIFPAVPMQAPFPTDAIAFDARRFCRNWIVSLCLIAAAIAGFNGLIDPFLLTDAPLIPGLNRLKPEAQERTPMIKPYLVPRIAPQTLIVGSSKAQIGFDPTSPLLPADSGRVMNLGIPGYPISQQFLVFDEVIAHWRIHRVLLLIDLVDFMGGPDAEQAAREADFHFLPDPERRASETLHAVLTLDALESSLKTIAQQASPYKTGVSRSGMMYDGSFLHSADHDGAEFQFREKLPILLASLRKIRAGQPVRPDLAIPNIDGLRRMIRQCRDGGMMLDIAIAPVQSNELRLIALMGLWPRYEAAKRAIAEAVAAEAPDNSVPLWDFMGFDAYSNDPIPPRGNRTQRPEWFWEFNHFKPALGDKILQAIYHNSPDYGNRVDPHNPTPWLDADEAALLADRRDRAGLYLALVNALRRE